MSKDAERDLIALVSREQRGFRFILFAGLAVLLVLVGMSAALGFYYYRVSQTLEQSARDLQQQAFAARIAMDQQNNRLATQETRVRRIQDEIRTGLSAGGARADVAAAVEATRRYLQRGAHSLAQERVIEAAAVATQAKAEDPAHALIAGAAHLIVWQRSGEQIDRDAADLPDQLVAARDAFIRANANPALSPLAQNGLAWVLFLNASSGRSNYTLADCEAVFAAIAASAENGGIGPQPLYWRAQCERKLGRTRESLLNYAHALEQTGALGSDDPAEIELAMNAFHGLGTTMIAAFGTHEDAEVRAALTLAERACAPDVSAQGSNAMRLARACLMRAMELRRRLHQTPNQVSGSGENLGFAYLRDEDYAGALQHAAEVERTGLFAWNELVRALAAQHAADGRTFAQARRNISFFRVGQFNLCELRALLSETHYAEAVDIIAREHRDEDVSCATA
jgi:hypothetical protein